MEQNTTFDIEVVLDTAYSRPKLVIYTSEMSEAVLALLKQFQHQKPQPAPHRTTLICEGADETIFVKHKEILRVYTSDGHLTVVSDKGEHRLKMRLYEVEALLDGRYFIPISQSEIVNFQRVEGIKTGITGAFALKLDNGSQAYVSRRYVTEIKKRLGMK